MRYFFIFIVLLFLSSCSSSNKLYFSHAAHGTVLPDSQFYLEDELQCSKKVYGNGVRIGDRTFYSRHEAAQYYIDIIAVVSFEEVRPHGNFGVTVDKSTLEKYRPPNLHQVNLVRQKYGIADNKFWKCISDKGWTKSWN